jgi:hypothetical protein
MFGRKKPVAPPPTQKPAPAPVKSSILAGEGRAMANRNQPAPTPGVVPIPTNLPKMSGPLGVAPKFSPAQQNQIMDSQRAQIATQAPSQLGLMSNATRGLPKMGGMGMKKGGEVKAKKMASGGKVSSASSRADGCAIKGKTKGRMV